MLLAMTLRHSLAARGHPSSVQSRPAVSLSRREGWGGGPASSAISPLMEQGLRGKDERVIHDEINTIIFDFKVLDHHTIIDIIQIADTPRAWS